MKLSYTTLLTQAWNSIKHQLPLVAGLTLVYLMGAVVLYRIPYLGAFATGPFTAGYMTCLLRIRNKQEIGYRDIFWGFLNLNRLAQFLILGLLTGFLMGLGFVLLIIPGIWFVVASTFSNAYLVLTDSDAVEAIKRSLAAVKGQWLNVLGFLCYCSILLLAGALCFLLGLLVAVPVTTMMFLIAAEYLAAKMEPANPQMARSSASVITVNPS